MALLGLGLLSRYKLSDSERIVDQATGDSAGLAALAFIIIGGSVFIVSFFGCCGAIRESHCMVTVVSNNNSCRYNNHDVFQKIVIFFFAVIRMRIDFVYLNTLKYHYVLKTVRLSALTLNLIPVMYTLYPTIT